MKKFWQSIEKLLGVYRWHPKIALRYLPIVDELKKVDKGSFNVLEVGSGGLGIAPYLKETVVGLDVGFQSPFYPSLIPVKGNATSIPFADNAFTAVISLDVLEHISARDRPQAISEMIRVAQKLVCIGVPCGKLAHEQDDTLRKFYQVRYQHDFPYLAEQSEYGLPEKEWMEETIEAECRKLKKKSLIRSMGNINLGLRSLLMRGWMTQNLLANIFFRKILLFFVPIMRHFNQEPTYRQLFFVTIVR